jgi:hypothetical protein
MKSKVTSPEITMRWRANQKFDPRFMSRTGENRGAEWLYFAVGVGLGIFWMASDSACFANEAKGSPSIRFMSPPEKVNSKDCRIDLMNSAHKGIEFAPRGSFRGRLASFALKNSDSDVAADARSRESEIGTIYRRTKNGWEDSSKWRKTSHSVHSSFGQIHPLVWAAIVLSLVLLSLFGFSKESEVDDFFHELDRFLSRENPTSSAYSKGHNDSR